MLKAELLFSKCDYSKGSCHCRCHLEPHLTATLSSGPGQEGDLSVTPKDPTKPEGAALAVPADPDPLTLKFQCPQLAQVPYLKEQPSTDSTGSPPGVVLAGQS